MQETRPCIGITPDVDLVRNRGVDYRRYTLFAEVCERVYEAGALPLILPYCEETEALEQLMQRLDALILTGGDFDIDPRLYHAKPHPKLGTLKPERSAFELFFCRRAYDDGMPILGICGGHQLLNVSRGGTLYQDLPSERESPLLHSQVHNRKVPAHDVDIAADSKLAQCCGAGSLGVNSTHHQGVRDLAAGLLATAHASDGLIEAIECPKHPFFVGIQWHPEALESSEVGARHLGIFNGLVQAAYDFMRVRGRLAASAARVRV